MTLKRRDNVLLEFYKSTLMINLAVSIFGLQDGIEAFFIFFCSIGLICSFIYKENFKKNEYYFYHNNGFSKQKLFIISLLINITISIIILFLYGIITD